MADDDDQLPPVHPENPNALVLDANNPDGTEAFLASLNGIAGGWQTVEEAWPRLATRLQHFLSGDSAGDQYSFDGILSTLLEKWTGQAADEFKKKAGDVRGFWLKVIANADHAAKAPPSGVPQSMRYEYGNVNTHAATATDVMLLMQGQHAEYLRARANFQTWIWNIAMLLAVMKWNGYEDGTPFQIPTFDEAMNGMHFGTFVEHMQTVRTQVWQGQGSASVSITPSGFYQSAVTYSGPSGSFTDNAIGWNGWDQAVWGKFGVNRSNVFHANGIDVRDKGHFDRLVGLLRTPEYGPYLRKIVTNLGDTYSGVKAPDPAKAPDMGTGNTQTQGSNGFPGGGSGFGAAPFDSSPYSSSPLDSSGYDPTDPSAYDPSAYDPGGYDPSGYDPSAYDPSAYDPSAYDPSAYDPSANDPGSYDPGGFGSGGPYDGGQLAGFDPGGMGAGGLYTPGSGSGLGDTGGGLGAGGLGTGGGAGGSGVDAAGLAAAGRSGMPMAPGAGAGGKDGKERQRQSWLNEDDDVWGADTDAPEGVL